MGDEVQGQREIPDAVRVWVHELARALLRAERRIGRTFDRPELARRLNVSPASLYAYLKGTTLPGTAVFDRLLAELGVVGAEAGRLATLRDEAELARRSRARTASRAPAVLPRPRQLPAGCAHFVGREAELETLEGWLATASEGDGVAVVVIDGPPGIGKTTLALQWAHRLADRFPDGQLHAGLRGFGRMPPTEPEEALHGWLQGLGVAPAAVPVGLASQSALLRSLLADRRMLLLADDARDAEQVRPLLPGTTGSLVIVTSRTRLDGLAVREGARLVTLDVLPHSSAVALLERQLGTERVAPEQEAAGELVELCARLPLALSVAAARAATRPGHSIAPLVTELRQSRGRLDALGLGGDPDSDLGGVFRSSYALLPAAQARLFRMFGVHPGPDLDARAAAAMLGVADPPRAELAGLAARHLLVETATGRYGTHDLLRLYARDLVERESPQEHPPAARRMLDFYLAGARAADVGLRPWQPVEPRGEVAAIRGHAEAMSWFEAEASALHAVVRFAAESGHEPYAWRIAWACAVFLRRSGRRDLRARVHRIAHDAAVRSGDRAAVATCSRLLADALARLGRRSEARSLLSWALAECERTGDDDAARQTHLSWVRLLDAQGLHAVALPHAEAALELASRSTDPAAEADGLTSVAKQLAALDALEESLAVSLRALAGYRAMGHLEGEADMLLHIGLVRYRLDRCELAAQALEQSLRLDRALGDVYWEARALLQLADVREGQGDPGSARACRTEALLLLEDVHHPDADRVRERLDAQSDGPGASSCQRNP